VTLTHGLAALDGALVALVDRAIASQQRSVDVQG